MIAIISPVVHFRCLYPLIMTMADPVPGIAQPRLAVTFTSFTARHVPVSE